MFASPLPSTPRVYSRSSFMRLTPKEPSGWRARFPKSCWHWENFCCCGSMLIAWSREMFPDRFLGILDWSRDGWGGRGELREDRSTFDGRALFRGLYVEDRLWVYDNLMGREHCSEAYNRRSFSALPIIHSQWWQKRSKRWLRTHTESFLGSTSNLKHALNPNIHADRCGKSWQVATDLRLTVSMLVLS